MGFGRSTPDVLVKFPSGLKDFLLSKTEIVSFGSKLLL